MLRDMEKKTFTGDGWTSVEMAGVSGGLAKAVNRCSAM